MAWAFSEGRDAQLVQGTYEELVKQGYITGEPLEESDAVFWEWKDGILFSITETDEPVTFNLPARGWMTAAPPTCLNLMSATRSPLTLRSGVAVWGPISSPAARLSETMPVTGTATLWAAK